MKPSFNDIHLLAWLNSSAEQDYDELDFGVVQMNSKGEVTAFNSMESRFSGIAKHNAKGKNFFTQIAPCTNNVMVADKYNQEILDETLDYMFTYIMKPRKVQLRLLKGKNGTQYLLSRNP